MLPHRTILFSPVSQVIHGRHVPPIGLVGLLQKVSDNCGSQMTGMEWLGNIRTTEFNDNVFSSTRCVGTIGSTCGQDMRDEIVTKVGHIEGEINKWTNVGNGGHHFIRRKLNVSCDVPLNEIN